MVKKKRPHKNDANLCRLKGWNPGTIVTVDMSIFASGSWTVSYLITAIGEKAILAKECYGDGRYSPERKFVQELVNKEVVNVSNSKE